MGKKRKFSLPGVLFYPNTFFVVAGSLAGLAIILCMEPKEDTFQPAYEERVALTNNWDETETVVLAGTVEEKTEEPTDAVPGVTDTPDREASSEPPESKPAAEEEPVVTVAPVEIPKETDEPEDAKQTVETEQPVENTPPEDNGMGENGMADANTEDTGILPKQDVTPDVEEKEPEEIRFTENTTKEDMEDTKPTDKPNPPADTKNPDKKPEYDEEVPVAGKTEETADKVYDPVFGWITTGEVVSDQIDNDGSLDKQVGTMGD